jgi:stage II sporulation protein D
MPVLIRSALLLGLLGACAQAPEPAVTIYGVIDGNEPVVRVYLRSLGTWETLAVEGKGGLRVTEAGARFSTADPVLLRNTQSKITLEPLEGVFFVADQTYSGRLVWEGGYLVNEVTLENYILGVLRGELPLKDVPVEAAAAQAIAARSYTLHYLARDRPHYDVDDTTLFQRYVGLKYAPDDGNLRAGVRATTGLYLDHEGRPLKAYYHSTCGGHTTDVPTGLGREPLAPMRGVKCDYCRASKYWRWSTDLTDAEILRAADLKGSLRALRVTETGPGERAKQVAVTTEGNRFVQAGEFRLALGASKLRSTRILKLVRVEGGYHVEGAGWGHGVGLCQMGALGLAREGKSGKEIAAHYYPGATLRRAY